MQTVIIIVLALSLAILSVCHFRQGKLLDKISYKYISDHNSLRNFASAYLAEEKKVTNQ
jgi:hypothetical protein